MDKIEVMHILCEARKGVSLHAATKEAVELSMREGRIVQLVFNSERFWINPSHIVDSILDRNQEKE